MKRRPPSPPEFIIDRSVGGRIVPEGLRSLGYVVHTMDDVYGEDAVSTPDTRWIADADDANWVVITKDMAITRHTIEIAALASSSLRVFAFAQGNYTGAQMVEILEMHINRIVRRSAFGVRRSAKAGPFVDVIRKGDVVRRWPRE